MLDFVANLDPKGFAWLRLTEPDTLDVHLRLDSLTPQWYAHVYVMGFADGSAVARCPGPEQDLDHDRAVTLNEAMAVTGAPVLEVATFAPTDRPGNLDVDTTLHASGVALADHVLVVVMSPPADVPDQIVACAAIDPATPDDPVWFDDPLDPAAPPGVSGSGALSVASVDPVSFEASLLCDADDPRQTLHIGIGENRSFDLGPLTTTVCAGGTFSGTGVGTYTEVAPTHTSSQRVTIELTLVDAGANGDQATFVIDHEGVPVLSGPVVDGDLRMRE